MAALEAKVHDHQQRGKMLELLRIFLDTHGLGLAELAGLLRITPQTLEEWFSEGMAPPASCLALAVLFDTRSQRRLGGSRSQVKPFFKNLQQK